MADQDGDAPVHDAAPPAPVAVQLAGAEWWPVTLPGKTPTRYKAVSKDGRQAVLAQAHASASLLRQRLSRPAADVGEVSFSWWVPQPLAGGDVRQVGSEDAVARVVFAFGGDMAKLPLRTRMQFELMQALTGEPPPYATLMYVFDGSAPVGSVVVNPRSDRIRKIVLDTGADGLKRWRDHRRDLRQDFQRAFGEDPGPLQAVAVMTDTDNTGGQAETWYGPVTFH
ncbi:MAG: DUF3047 domain-containing protein [Rubrivivax sp.]